MTIKEKELDKKKFELSALENHLEIAQIEREDGDDNNGSYILELIEDIEKTQKEIKELEKEIKK